MKKIAIIGTSLATTGLMAVSGLGIASAATNSTKNTGNVGSSGIPRGVFQQDRQQAVAEVLNTTTANVQAAHKNHTLKQLISNAGLTKKTFAQKAKAQLTSELESQGYSQQQVTIALQHKQIVKLHHRAKKAKK